MFSPHFLPPQLLPSDLAYGFHPETPGSLAMNDMARYQAVQHVMLHSQYAMYPVGPGAFALPGLGMGMQVTSLPIFSAGSHPVPQLPLQEAEQEAKQEEGNVEGEEGQPS